MASPVWRGGADKVQQVTTVTVGGTISGETFTIQTEHPSRAQLGASLVTIATYDDTDTMAATVATNLATQWNASNHPFANDVTAEANAGVITFTSDVSGKPFTLTLNTPGGSATFTQSTTTENSGPNDWEVGGNWSTGTKPAGSDNVMITGTFPILYGPPAVVDLAVVDIADYSGTMGELGLPFPFGDITTLNIDTLSALLHVTIYTANTATTVNIINTSQAHPYGLYFYRLQATTVNVHGGNTVAGFQAPGGGGTTTTLNLIDGRIEYLHATVITNLKQTGGLGVLRNTGTTASAIVEGGELQTYSSVPFTAMAIQGPTAKVISNSSGTIATLNGYSGEIDFTQSLVARTVTTTNHHQPFRMKRDRNIVTFTNAPTEFGAFEVKAA